MTYKEFLVECDKIPEINKSWVQRNRCYHCLEKIDLDCQVSISTHVKEAAMVTFTYHQLCAEKIKHLNNYGY